MEKKKGYSMFERDKLDPADSMRIERNIYFEEQTADLSGLTALPLEQLQALREEYAAAEQAAFEALQEQAAAWDEQAGKTLAIDKAIEYVRTPEATHTANQWEATDYGESTSATASTKCATTYPRNTRYDREKREIHSLFVDAFMEYLHQQPPTITDRQKSPDRKGKSLQTRQLWKNI